MRAGKAFRRAYYILSFSLGFHIAKRAFTNKGFKKKTLAKRKLLIRNHHE